MYFALTLNLNTTNKYYKKIWKNVSGYIRLGILQCICFSINYQNGDNDW